MTQKKEPAWVGSTELTRLRDRFAEIALAKLLISPNTNYTNIGIQAYNLADKMLLARDAVEDPKKKQVEMDYGQGLLEETYITSENTTSEQQSPLPDTFDMDNKEKVSEGQETEEIMPGEHEVNPELVKTEEEQAEFDTDDKKIAKEIADNSGDLPHLPNE